MLQFNVAIRILVCFLFIFIPLSTLDEWFYDLYFRLQVSQMEPTNLVLVKVPHGPLTSTSTSTRTGIPAGYTDLFDLKNHSVWYPEFYQALLQRIQSAKPKAIVFTTYYQWVEDLKPSFDLPPHTVLSALLDEDHQLIPPPKPLTQGENYGYSNLFADSDNVIRKTFLTYSSGPSLALKVQDIVNPTSTPRHPNLPLWIDFRGKRNSYLNIDALELITEKDFEINFKDKIVLIGKDGGETFKTPYGNMSRLEVQANIIDTLLNGREIIHLPHWVNYTLSAFIVVFSISLILYFPLQVGWISLIGLFLIIFVSTLIAFTHFKVWPGVANPILCIFWSHLVMLGYKLNRQEEKQWIVRQEADKLREMDQFKNNFISLFSHDLKTPIAKIKAVTERMLSKDTTLSTDSLKDVRTIEQSNAELEKLIGDILKVTKMETMSINPSREVIDINRLVEKAIKRLHFLANEKNITLVLDLEPLFAMEGDENLIQEVITNLVENAIKYSPKDKKVIIRTRELNDRVYVSVVDEGNGIPKEELPKVTSKFYRGKDQEKTTKGSGLGLYLSKYFVELHAGQLEIKSILNKGTDVTFWIPLDN